jgi:hypothetical protein
MVMMNQIAELLSHFVTLRFVALILTEMISTEATMQERNHSTISQPSDIIDFPSAKSHSQCELKYRRNANSPEH